MCCTGNRISVGVFFWVTGSTKDLVEYLDRRLTLTTWLSTEKPKQALAVFLPICVICCTIRNDWKDIYIDFKIATMRIHNVYYTDPRAYRMDSSKLRGYAHPVYFFLIVLQMTQIGKKTARAYMIGGCKGAYQTPRSGNRQKWKRSENAAQMMCTCKKYIANTNVDNSVWFGHGVWSRPSITQFPISCVRHFLGASTSDGFHFWAFNMHRI